MLERPYNNATDRESILEDLLAWGKNNATATRHSVKAIPDPC
ncbi:hypothetical protein ATG_01610 [Desulfurococcaceae archaeon AG1]|nr:hypothetical protein ATG_01610 [Desulfurococcaceae archaeon AG1]